MCMYVRIYVCMYECMYVWLCMYVWHYKYKQYIILYNTTGMSHLKVMYGLLRVAKVLKNMCIDWDEICTCNRLTTTDRPALSERVPPDWQIIVFNTWTEIWWGAPGGLNMKTERLSDPPVFTWLRIFIFVPVSCVNLHLLPVTLPPVSWTWLPCFSSSNHSYVFTLWASFFFFFFRI